MYKNSQDSSVEHNTIRLSMKIDTNNHKYVKKKRKEKVKILLSILSHLFLCFLVVPTFVAFLTEVESPYEVC